MFLRNLKDSFCYELKISVRSIWFKIVACVFCALIVFQLGFVSLDAIRIGDTLTLSGVIVSAFIIIGLFMGYQLATEEYNNDCSEVIDSIYDAFKIKVYSKIILISLLGGIIGILSISMFYLILFFRCENSYYFQYSGVYIVYYWVFPFLISGFLGLWIGIMDQLKRAYIYLIIFGVVLSPIMPYLLAPLIHIDNKLFQYFSVFSIGQLNYDYSMNASLGYDIQSRVLLVRILYLFSLFLFIQMQIMKRQNAKKNNLQSAIVSICAVIVLLSGMYTNQSYIYDEYPVYISNRLEKTYSDQEEYRISEKNRTLNYDIAITEKRWKGCFDISAVMDIEALDSISEVELNLYHGFNIKNIEVNNSSCDFYRTQDDICVSLPQNVSKGSVLQLKIEYSGLPVETFYKENSWVLPGFFSWIPKSGHGSDIQIKDGYDMSFSNKNAEHEIECHVRYYGKKDVVCNLQQTGENEWHGKASDAISLMSYWENTASVGDRRYHYPAVAVDYQDNIKRFDELLEGTIRQISEDFGFGDDAIQNLKEIYIVSDIGFLGYGDVCYLMQDSAVFWITKAYLDGNRFCNPNLLLRTVMINMLFENTLSDKQDVILADIFLASYVESLLNREAFSKDYLRNTILLSDLIDQFEESGLEDYKETSLAVKQFIHEQSDKNVINFLRSYWDLLNQDDNLEIDEIKELLMDYKE